jgi:hypothetical protein
LTFLRGVDGGDARRKDDEREREKTGERKPGGDAPGWFF